MFMIILGILLLISAVAAMTSSAVLPGLILLVLGIFLLVRGIKRRKAAKSAPAAAAPAPDPVPAADPVHVPDPVPAVDPAPKAEEPPHLHFRLAGVTFKNRQRILQHIADMDDGYESNDYHLEQTEYKGEPAFRVIYEMNDLDMTEKDIGMVPEFMVKKVLKIFDRITYMTVEVYGGDEDDKSYGAAADVYYEPEEP